MVLLTVTSPDPTEIGQEIGHDIQADTLRGLEAAAALVPGFIRETFDAGGARGGVEPWKRLTFRTIGYRRSWQEDAPFGWQMAYFKAHKPLIDTGALRESFVEVGREESEGVVVIYIGTPLDYGEGQELGTTVTPDGFNVWARPHLHLVEGEDTDRLDAAFEGAWL